MISHGDDGLTAYCVTSENIKNMYYGLWTMDYGFQTAGIKSKLSIKH